jgi:hypothetical protein
MENCRTCRVACGSQKRLKVEEAATCGARHQRATERPKKHHVDKNLGSPEKDDPKHFWQNCYAL